MRASVWQKFDIAFDKKFDIRPNKLPIIDKKFDIAFDKKIDIRPNKLPIIDLIFCPTLTEITHP